MPQAQKHSSPIGPRIPSSRLLLVASLMVVLVVPLLTGALLSWHSLGELDVWLHQRAGQDILAGEGLPDTNSYSYTQPDHPWTNHEWLFQVLIAATGPGANDLEAGINRWVILRLLLTLLLLTILLVGDRPWRAPPLRLFWVAPGIFLGVAMLWPRILLRPELVSYALMILLIRFAELPALGAWSVRTLISVRSREGKAFWTTLIWAQFHGFSALAPFIWLLAGLLGFIPHSGFSRTSPARLSAGTVILLLALILTPNGWQGLVYPLLALGQFFSATVDIQSNISELQPLLQTHDGLNLTLLAFQLSLVWGVLYTVLEWPRRNLLRTSLWLLAAVATLGAQRNLGFYALTFTLMQTEGSHQPILNSWSARIKKKIPGLAAVLPVVMVLAGATWFFTALVSDDFYLAEGQSRRFGSGPSVARFPFQAADILSRTPGTRVFANVDAASMTLSRGKAQVFIDGRTEAYSPNQWLQYQTLRQAGGEGLKILDQCRTQGILLSLGGRAFHPLLHALLESPQWSVLHADPAAVLLRRSKQPASSAEVNALAAFALQKQPIPESSLSKTRQADLLAAEATLLNLAGLADEGESRLRQGLELRPTHPLLNHNLGNLLLQKGQTRPAVKYFQQALQTNPRLSGSALNAGVCLMKMGEFQEAEKMFARAAELQPDNFQTWVNRSLALQQLGRHQEAYDAMKEAVRLNPDNPRLRQVLQEFKSQI